MRVGVFGGTFDPPHVGHVHVAATALEVGSLDLVLWVPVAIHPHGSDRAISPGSVRRRLIEAAIQGVPQFRLCDLELERGGVSYTIDTLTRLSVDHPDWTLHLIVGSDVIGGFSAWKDPHGIAKLASILVIPRPGDGFEGAPNACGGRDVSLERKGQFRYRVATVKPRDVSSSRVRKRIAENLAVRDMVTPAVLAIIEGEGLYARPASGSSRNRDTVVSATRADTDGKREK